MSEVLSRLRLDPGSGLGLGEQLRSQIALLIADGRLRPGDPLPPLRTLSRELEVSVNTVRSAYARLEADGVVRTRQGAGTIVLDSAPQGLRTGSARLGSNTVGVLIAGLDPFYLPLLRGIEEVADEHGMLVLVADAQDSHERVPAIVRRLIARGVDGLITAFWLDSAGLADRTRHPAPPIVHVDQPGATAPSLVFDAEHAGYLAADHLLDHGHERIGIVTAPIELANVAPLYEGYARALRERGIEPRREWIVEVPLFGLVEGRRGLRRLLEVPDPPTAVFAAAAGLALGVIDEARRQRVSVPGDLAVVGYIDIETATLVQPPITMVSVPAREIGVRAMTTLRRLIAGQKVSTRQVVLDVELVVRSSCGPH